MLGERLPLVGTNNTLNYRSDRVLGRNSASLKNETWRFAYTDKGLITAAANARDNVSVYTYDEEGRIVSNRNAQGEGNTFMRSEDAEGLQITKTDALSNITRYTVAYSASGDTARSFIAPNGATTTMIQQANGATLQIDQRGVRTTTVQGPDPRWGMNAPIVMRQTRATPAGEVFYTLEATRTVVLADNADPLSLQTQTDTVTVNGRTTTTVYDALQRTFTVTDPAGKATVSIVDGQGRPLRVDATNLASVVYSYDARGRLAAVQEGVGAILRRTVFSYDSMGYLSSSTDALNYVTAYGHDSAGRITSRTLPTGQILQFAYDAMGNLTASSDAQGIVTAFTYDGAEHMISQTIDPGGRSVHSEYRYDLAGNLLAKVEDVGTGGLNATTVYTYAALSASASILLRKSPTPPTRLHAMRTIWRATWWPKPIHSAIRAATPIQCKDGRRR